MALFFFFFFSQTLVVVFIIFLYDEMIFKDCLRVLLLTLVFFYRSNWITSLSAATNGEEKKDQSMETPIFSRLELEKEVDGFFFVRVSMAFFI